MIHGDDAPMLGQLAHSARMFGMQAENSPDPDRLLQDKDVVSFGDIKLEVVHVPGHSPGGVAFIGDAGVFVGDTLFAGSIGRTDLPGGNFDTLITSIQNRLFQLDDDTPVYPGHMGPTSIGQEKRFNPFCAIR
jgi:glyoxylase-like metal-dependent hydrolase (beta-lactamase superfamily II)